MFQIFIKVMLKPIPVPTSAIGILIRLLWAVLDCVVVVFCVDGVRVVFTVDRVCVVFTGHCAGRGLGFVDIGT